MIRRDFALFDNGCGLVVAIPESQRGRDWARDNLTIAPGWAGAAIPHNEFDGKLAAIERAGMEVRYFGEDA